MIGLKYLEVNCLYFFLFVLLRLKIGQLSIINDCGIYADSEIGPRTINSEFFSSKCCFFSQ